MWRVSLLGLLAPTLVLAQEPEPSEQAREAFAGGNEAFQREAYPEAIRLFRSSLEELPYLPTAHNLSMALERNGDLLDAARLSAEILDGRYGDVDDALRQNVETRLRELDAELSRLIVEVSPSDTDRWVRIDSEPERAMPARGSLAVRVLAGEHRIEVGGEGHRSHSVAIRVAEGQEREVRVDLERTVNGVLVVEGPPTRRVEIVGVAQGQSPLERSLPVGLYDVGIVGAPESRQSVSLAAGQTQRVRLETPAPVEQPPPPSRSARRWAIALLVIGVAAVVTTVVVATRVSNDDSLLTLEF